MARRTIITIAGGVALAILVITLTFFWIIPNLDELSQIFASRQSFKDWINGLGLWGPAVFLVVTIVQVIVAPIPGNVVGFAGGTLFGIWWGFGLSYVGILVGSILAFFLGRLLGQRLVTKIIGETRYTRYSKLFRGSFSWTLLLVFLVPIFPDDLLCILAGLSPLSFRRFVLLVAIGRLPSVFINNLVGAGLLELPELTVPWWGWLIAGGLVLVVSLVYLSNRQRINKWAQQQLGLDDE